MTTKQNLTQEFFTGAEVAKKLNVNRSRVRQLCLRGRLEGTFKFGETWLIPQKAFETYKKQKPGRKKADNLELIASIKALKAEQRKNEKQTQK